MSLKLFYDIDSNANIVCTENINEETGQKEKVYKIRGVFSSIGLKNRNGRVYPREIWEHEVERYQNEIANGTINTLMEYQHPARTKVDLMEAVAKINKLWIEGEYVMGEAVLLNNPKAQQLKTLIDNGIKISVSSRGVGSLVDNVVKSFNLITYDIVPDPSDYNATMNGLVENYQLCEGIINDLSFEVDKHGNLLETVNDEDDVVETDEPVVNNKKQKTEESDDSDDTVDNKKPVKKSVKKSKKDNVTEDQKPVNENNGLSDAEIRQAFAESVMNVINKCINNSNKFLYKNW